MYMDLFPMAEIKNALLGYELQEWREMQQETKNKRAFFICHHNFVGRCYCI